MRKLKRTFPIVMFLRDPKVFLVLFLIGASIILYKHTQNDQVMMGADAERFRQRLLHQENGRETVSIEKRYKGHLNHQHKDGEETIPMGTDNKNDDVNGELLPRSHQAVNAPPGRKIELIPDTKSKRHPENVEKHGRQNSSMTGTLPRFSSGEYPHRNLTKILRQYEEKGFSDVKPINVLDYQYMINPNQTCEGSDTIRVLFIVKSAPHHFSKREIIRYTWADRKRFPWSRTIFSLGIPKENITLEDLHGESSRYQDIFLADYLDSYLNLTLKTMSGLNWAVTYCYRALHVVSVDDDMYVAPDLLLRFLDNLPKWKAEALFSGHRLDGTKPIRVSTSKWYTPKTEYPFRNYPPYIFGGFVIMSMSTVKNFTVAAQYTQLFKFEDVYLGILAARLGIRIRDNAFVNSGRTFTASSSFKSIIASHYYGNLKDLRNAWDCHLSILDGDHGKSVFCDFIGKRLKQLKSEINSIADWMEFVQNEIV
ncbi:beta-1,3-galactosyltransferase brn-like [Argopecten irradians]|uniref:beta-1,3-galactosyltransferase brn-like n=1 Tax=Argopecten irradians TaxID=31199 RepID=UPI00371C9251